MCLEGVAHCYSELCTTSKRGGASGGGQIPNQVMLLPSGMGNQNKLNSAMKSLFSVHLNLWVESETHFRNFHRDLTFDGVRMAAF